jgi:uroporphyrin-III C-methyltransferase / precorrin-2 dehydrogenase / sirohydrochlorin ferrochelatase
MAALTPKTGRTPKPAAPERMQPLATLPLFFKLAGVRVVVAGGDAPAAWKAELIAAAGAHIDLYAAAPCEEVEALAATGPASGGRITLHRRAWQADDLFGARLAIGAIEDDAEGQRFVAAARAAGVPVNVVDRPPLCDFQFGSIVNRSPLVVAISTDGAAPVFGQAIRAKIEAMLPLSFTGWAQAAKRWRPVVQALGLSFQGRRRVWETFVTRAMAPGANAPTACDLVEMLGTSSDVKSSDQPRRGSVALVGAGPGDPDLLTLKALRVMQSADVILYDDLVTPAVLDLARREARRIGVGKRGHGPSCSQVEINAMMVELATSGQRVVRLKSGDPMVFGRAGEEITALAAAGVPFEVVAGVSAAQGAAASLGVSLTHRHLSNRVQFITGHSTRGDLPDNLDWSALADPNATTVVYMPRRTLSALSARMQAHGLSATCPAIAVFNASRADEFQVSGTIADLPGRLSGMPSTAPCLVMVGAALATRQGSG